MSRSAITQGIAETAHPEDAAPPDRARMFGGGRKKIGEKYPRYERELENLLDAAVIGDPEKPLRNVSKSNLSQALRARVFRQVPKREENAQTAGISDAGEPEGQKRRGRPS
jgi:hypothetical protein